MDGVVNENAVALAALALCGTLTTGFFGLIAKLSKSIDKNTHAHGVVASTNKEIAKAVNKQSRESAERNGHIAQLILDSKKDIIESTTHIAKQEVDNSTVNKLVVKE